ncbi:hypothetical protein RDI58_029163 [Solanum bulbocastanum]|uniref:Uncharacterized protein n=1 Tax=Solanum bulbocastanum TaxID=147425 RepID=A0AAN8SPW1_SOLBU
MFDEAKAAIGGLSSRSFPSLLSYFASSTSDFYYRFLPVAKIDGFLWDKGDVEIVDAEENVPASDALVSNEPPVKYENGVKTGKSNIEDKTHDQSDSKGEDSKNARSETEYQLNSKSQLEAHDNVVLEKKTPTIDA